MDLENTIKGLPIDLHEIELVKADDSIKGKGMLSLNANGLIELKIFPDIPKEFTVKEFFESYNQSNANAGKILSEESYYSFKGTAVNNDQYLCRRLLITDQQNLRVYTGKLCSDLIITNDPEVESFHVARIQIPYKISLPSNHSLQVERIYSDRWRSRSVTREIFEIEIEDLIIDIFTRSDRTVVLIQKKETVISEDDVQFIITTLEFLTSSIIDRYSTEYEERGKYKRIFRYSFPQRMTLTKGEPPLSISGHAKQEFYSELFVKYYSYIKNNGIEPLKGMLWRVISAQSSFITVYALTITTAIENILHSFYATGKSSYSKSDNEAAISEIYQTKISEQVKKRLIGMINNIFGQESADDIIRGLIKKRKLDKRFYGYWKKLRNPVSHGKDPTEDFQEYLNLCESNLVFFHCLILLLIKYEGGYSDYSTFGYPIIEMNYYHEYQAYSARIICNGKQWINHLYYSP